VTLRPEWSEVFAVDRLRPVRPLPLLTPVTHDWAFGTSTGAGVRVAVVDSGIEDGHPLVGAVQGGVGLSLDPATGEVVADDHTHDDIVGHGTACAGVIRRLAPDCELLSVRVLGDSLTGRGPVFAAGLQWALEAGAQVVNCSLSTGRADYAAVFHDVVDAAAHRGVIVVCAVNNVAGTSLPATFASVISVAAHEGTDPNCWYANPDPPVDFGAPGIEVEVAWRGGGTIVTTGNSFAAPHISGHVARLLGRHPGLTAYEVKTILRACAANATATRDGRTG
jgi:subtilisin family serine protease